jgi:aminopeptidase N
MQNYLARPCKTKDLVRFHYNDKEDVFDAGYLPKRWQFYICCATTLGNDAFYKGLNIYLKTNAFKNGEAHQLRLALKKPAAAT